MKRITTDQPHILAPAIPPAPRPDPPVRTTRRTTQSAGFETDWPASARLDNAIERVVREAIQSGMPLQEALAKVAELTQAEQSPLSEHALNRRLRAQLIADS